MMNTLKLFNDEKLREIVGGRLATRFGTSYNDLVGHFGQHFDKYESEKHLGNYVIIRKNFYHDNYYVGVLRRSWEDDYWVTSVRRIEIEYNDGKTRIITNPDDCWVYIH